MIFWGILGSVCLVYFVIICIYAGISSAFAWFWTIGGVGGFFLCFFWHRMSDRLQRGIWGIFLVGLAVFAILEGKILYYGSQQPQKEADYLIVLGCQIRGQKITRSLKYRLEKAAEYAEENPNTRIIVSGGQGSGEDVSEAQAMKEYLVKKGIGEDRIEKEDTSTNTYENMKFSWKLIEAERKAAGLKKKDFRTIIVSSRFHLCRALMIGKKQGFVQLEGLGAKTDPVLAVSYYIREALALLKDSLFGNL